MIKIVLFDADGVLINGRMASYYFEEKYGINREITQSFYRGPFQDCLVGKKDMRKLLPPYLKKWGWEKSMDDFILEWFKAEHSIDDELIKYIKKLRQENIRCYVATNQEKHRAQYMLDKMGFSTTFDGLFASAHLGHTKTDIQFFEKVLRKFPDVDKKEILFWDDDAENVRVAKEFGLNAEVYTDLENFLRRMHSVYNL